MTNWPKDNTTAKREFYGDFNSKSWATENLVRIKPPFQMYYDKKPVDGIVVHRKVAEAMMAAFEEIWEKCDRDQAKVDKSGASDYAGCFNIRKISGSDNWSNHSWAIAIDLSPKTNGFGAGKGTLSQIVVDAFKRQGARWGGDYRGRTDPMHFEFVEGGRPPTTPSVRPTIPTPAPDPTLLERPGSVADRPELEYGAKGEAVKELQRLLFVDGEFGIETKRALIRFQRRKGLEPDGVVGPRTWAALIGR